MNTKNSNKSNLILLILILLYGTDNDMIIKDMII